MLVSYARRASPTGGGGGGGGGSHLDTQTVITGQDGRAIDANRRRGFISGVIGSISDGTSNLYAGAPAPITSLYWDEGGGFGSSYIMTITGAVNSGWVTLTIGAKVLNRVDATFSGGTWTWTPADNGGSLSPVGSTKTIYFD